MCIVEVHVFHHTCILSCIDECTAVYSINTFTLLYHLKQTTIMSVALLFLIIHNIEDVIFEKVAFADCFTVNQ